MALRVPTTLRVLRDGYDGPGGTGVLLGAALSAAEHPQLGLLQWLITCAPFRPSLSASASTRGCCCHGSRVHGQGGLALFSFPFDRFFSQRSAVGAPPAVDPAGWLRHAMKRQEPELNGPNELRKHASTAALEGRALEEAADMCSGVHTSTTSTGESVSLTSALLGFSDNFSPSQSWGSSSHR